MAEKTQVTLSEGTLEFCRDMLIRQIEATYDEPSICDHGCQYELKFLGVCARELGVDFAQIIANNVPVAARQRMVEAVRVEQAKGGNQGLADEFQPV
jgi:hypothetical protein